MTGTGPTVKLKRCLWAVSVVFVHYKRGYGLEIHTDSLYCRVALSTLKTRRRSAPRSGKTRKSPVGSRRA
jgi:hypothetical protein